MKDKCRSKCTRQQIKQIITDWKNSLPITIEFYLGSDWYKYSEQLADKLSYMIAFGHEEPKPCPFCGSKKIYQSKSGYNTPEVENMTYSYVCNDCGAMVRTKHGYDTALQKWNMRDGE